MEHNYQRTKMQKERVIQMLKDRGCRITKQRQILLDIILEGDCACCKEIYFQAQKKDAGIGTATVYRMVNTLEEIGAISRKNLYKITCDEDCQLREVCTIEFEDNTVEHLSVPTWRNVILAGLKACGYTGGQNVKNIIVPSFENIYNS